MPKYPWGDTSFPGHLMPVPIACGAAVVAAVTIFTTPTGPAVPGKIPGVVLVTLLWTWNIYQIVGAQVLVNMGQGSRLNPAAKHVSERIMGNTLEQALPFLTTTWMYALYIDDARAMSLGLTYVAYRALYPIVYAKFGHFTIGCEFCTQPAYCCVMYQFVGLMKVMMGIDDYLPSTPSLLAFSAWFVTYFVGCIVNMALFWNLPTGALIGSLNDRANPKLALKD